MFLLAQGGAGRIPCAQAILACKALGIDWAKEYMTPDKRPIRITDKGLPVAKLIDGIE